MQQETATSRFIGVRHRVKQTAEGEAKPTQLAIVQDGQMKPMDLATETDELDWVKGVYPTKYRRVEAEDDLARFAEHHVKWRRLAKEADLASYLQAHLKQEEKDWYVATQVPAEYDGLKPGDVIAMILGGSGNNLAYALSRRAETLGGNAKVFRIPPFKLKKQRGDRTEEQDALTLVELIQAERGLFYEVGRRDRHLIAVRESIFARTEVMKARIACEQRIRSYLIGRVFCTEEGLFPEGSVEKMYDEAKANSKIRKALLEEESDREKEVARALKGLDVWEKVLSSVEGCGPLIAANLISAIVDIRRFETKHKLKAFCGVHVLPDGRFARRRRDQDNNWNPMARQALFLLGDQFVRRADSTWGKVYREHKVRIRKVHPEVETITNDGDNGKVKTRWSDIHVHRTAIWKSLTDFVEWLHGAWWELEPGQPGETQ